MRIPQILGNDAHASTVVPRPFFLRPGYEAMRLCVCVHEMSAAVVYLVSPPDKERRGRRRPVAVSLEDI